MGDYENSRSVCRAVSFTDVKIHSLFWDRILKTHHEVTIRTVINRCFESKRVENFIKAEKYLQIGLEKPLPKELEFEGRFYDDSDVYKAIEGASYSLLQYADIELEEKLDEIIDSVSSAQWADGYLMTFYTIDPQNKSRRWTDMDRHEMYNGGHLIEAAIAYYRATGKNKLLNVAIRMVEHWISIFGSDKNHWVEGHQEPELALVKLYELTGDRRYLNFSLWLLSERGSGHYISSTRPYIDDKKELFYKSEYAQDHLPVEKQSFVCGHAVRAMYMYSGMADVAKYFNKKDYIAALEKIWENTVHRNMYITGGIGSSSENEGFSDDFDLPNASAYAETCAAIGMVFFNHRMNLLHKDAKYAHIIEKELYNGILAGVSLSGDRFFYANPLEVTGQAFLEGEHKRRQEWYKTSCCPTNIARFIPCISEYIYAEDHGQLYINQYISSTGNIRINDINVNITQKTDYPWNGKIEINFSAEENVSPTLCFRVPDWCEEYSYKYSGKTGPSIHMQKGYVCMDVILEKNSTLSIDFVMTVRKTHMDPRVIEDSGKTALQRGPVIYAFEKADNPLGIDDIYITRFTRFDTIWDSQMLGGIMKLKVSTDGKQWLAIPYYTWDNREPGAMRVFVDEEIDNSRSAIIYNK
ncbi:MAG TPA: beta-L-arabinofuranosidase domain-containing protein [Clostridia bacterium]|nr:beta-L-arabinofuranosidase domain-containing protein [Clostridia bacterium]